MTGGWADVAWCDWEPLDGVDGMSAEGLRETLDGGQMFRWRWIDDAWCGVWGRCAARVRLIDGGRLEASYPLGDEAACRAGLLRLLRVDGTLERALDALPWRSDAVLRAAMAACPGLRVVCQPLSEALLGFLCSPAKRIVQIKEAVGLLAERFGAPLPCGLHALPEWSTLDQLDMEQLWSCKLGYRARHVAATARCLAESPGLLDRVAALDYPAAREALMDLPGVGGKVADCVLLYGSPSLRPFPSDTWILQAMARLYGLEGWRPEQVAAFGRAHFGEAAGLAQQFLFVRARRGSLKA